MVEYILRGDPGEVAKVIRENRIRVERGVIEFAPVQPCISNTDNAEDSKYVISDDSKAAHVPTPKKTRTQKSE